MGSWKKEGAVRIKDVVLHSLWHLYISPQLVTCFLVGWLLSSQEPPPSYYTRDLHGLGSTCHAAVPCHPGRAVMCQKDSRLEPESSSGHCGLHATGSGQGSPWLLVWVQGSKRGCWERSVLLLSPQMRHHLLSPPRPWDAGPPLSVSYVSLLPCVTNLSLCHHFIQQTFIKPLPPLVSTSQSTLHPRCPHCSAWHKGAWLLFPGLSPWQFPKTCSSFAFLNTPLSWFCSFLRCLFLSLFLVPCSFSAFSVDVSQSDIANPLLFYFCTPPWPLHVFPGRLPSSTRQRTWRGTLLARMSLLNGSHVSSPVCTTQPSVLVTTAASQVISELEAQNNWLGQELGAQ